MSRQARNIAIIGLGTFGLSIARELTGMGDIVLGIDRDEALVSKVNGDLAETLQVDAMDMRALQECSLETYDVVVVSIGENLEASIIAAMNAKELGCGQVLVKAQTETQKKILMAIGVDRVVLPERDYGANLAELIHNPAVQDFLVLDEQTNLAALRIKESVARKVMKNTTLFEKYGLTCVGRYHQCQFTPLDGSEDIEGDQTLLLLGQRKSLRAFADS